MSTCCDQPDKPTIPSRTDSRPLVIALAGNPNSGKTTLFNALTGLRQRVANYPGITVEKKTGRCRLPNDQWVDVVDLPGTYSLISRSPDEQVAMEVLRGLRRDTPAPDVVIVVVDASNLQRNLYLVSQLIELGRPMVVALNMMDVAERRGLKVSPEALERELGVPVVPVVGLKRRGINELKDAIARAAKPPLPAWALPWAMQEEVALVGGALAILDDEPAAGENALPRCQVLAERLLIGDRAADIAPIADRTPIASLLHSSTNRLAALGIDPMQADIEAHYRWIDDVAHRTVTHADGFEPSNRPLPLLGQSPAVVEPRDRTLTQKVDAILVHRVWGLLIFALVMTALFVTIFWVADPVMGGLEKAVGWVGDVATARLPEGPLKSLLVDGIFKGVSAVVVFLPQIAFLFFFLAVLEDSGYLARAAFLMDKLLAKVGLHGKSFIPLLSSFACAIPGIMATRTIESRKDRLATIFVAPFMSCSARLPVYLLLIPTFFGQYNALTRGGIMAALYLLGIVAAAGTAWVFKRTFLRGPAAAFILEMPTYKLPQLSQVARQVWTNAGKFLSKAGTIIFCLSVVLWATMYYGPGDVKSLFGGGPPRAAQVKADGGDENAVKAARLDDSFAGHFGQAMEPAIRPLGYDWKMGVGLVSAFAAREVFVSTLGIVYSVGEVEDDTAGLKEAMQADRYTSGPHAGQPVWTPLVAVSLLVWFVLAMQCMSTLAVVRRETGGWRWPIFMLVYMNAVAYVVAFAVYQGGRIFLR